MLWFHTRVGFPGETAFYKRNYPKALCIEAAGMNVTNYAAVLASPGGWDFAHIAVVGADCWMQPSEDHMPPDDAPEAAWAAWKGRQVMYPDGRDCVTAFGPSVVPVEGVLGGRRIVSRPDMLESARYLVALKRRMGSRLELIGDTLPNWLLKLPQEHLDAFLPKVEGGVVTGFKSRAS